IDQATGYEISQRSGDVGSTSQVQEMSSRPAIDYSTVPIGLHRAYHGLAGTASSEQHALSELKEIYSQAFPSEVEERIAVRRPLFVFRAVPADDDRYAGTTYGGDTVALPEIVNPNITRLIGEQVVLAQYLLDSLANSPEIAEASLAFRSVQYVLSRSHDRGGAQGASLRTYKEGILTAAQTISFLSEGIESADQFHASLATWERDKTIETLAACMTGAILGPLAVRGVQPMARYTRSSDGTMRADLRSALHTISSGRKQRAVVRAANSLNASSMATDQLKAMGRRELVVALGYGEDSRYLSNWGCLASPRVIRHATQIALTRLREN
ncbi:MAG TPA: hypothetical protein VFM05_12220, partial [Candidatus Saccharimonadales bacterium]|nr:hypothetical protein [Candidatus Saccharimonadales bacterium]